MEFKLPFTNRRTIIALGAETGSTGCLLRGERAYLTSPISDSTNPKELSDLKNNIAKLLASTKIKKVDAIACDLHPRFQTTELAYEMAEKYRVPLFKIQHHHAHAVSLMVEHSIRKGEEIVAIVCDGVGHGSDGTAWGGEILKVGYSKFLRLGHLKSQPMPGGDKAVEYPVRMVAGMLYSKIDKEELEMLLSKRYVHAFPHGKEEIKITLAQLERNFNCPKTSSCGRVLDALAVLTEACVKRSYEGEPAISLEKLASKGKAKYKFPELVVDGEIDTTSLLLHALKLVEEGVRKEDVAASSQKALARALANLAITLAKKEGIRTIGWSGGVAYNKAITSTIEKLVEENKLTFLKHEKLPPGDGNLSLGQVAVAATQL